MAGMNSVGVRADGVHDGHLQARAGEARRAQVARIPRQAGAHPLRLPAVRDRHRLLRQAEVDLQGLRLVRLRARRLPPVRPREARYPVERRPRRRALDHRPPRQGLRARQGARREAARRDPAAAVRGGHPGRHRQPRHRARDGEGDGQERHRQVLWRRHHAQAQAAREAEGRQEAHEAGGPRRGPPGGVSHGAQELMDVRESEVHKTNEVTAEPITSARRRAGPRRPGLRHGQGAGRAVRAPPRRAAGRPRPVDLLRLRVRLRPDGGAGGLVLRHGRQPQQLPGQPLLGVRPQGQDQGQGVPDLLVLGQRSALAALVETRALHPVGPADTRPTGRALGFYLHVPFCVQRCHYCSFNTAPLEAGQMDPYLRALHGELDLLGALDWARDVSLATVFLGGGTPSLLEPEALAAVLEHLRERWRLAPDAEITVECNPESVTRGRPARYRAAGVTRVSLGVQAPDDAAARGFEHYEVSTSARRGRRARHNLGYWRAAEYLAAGPGGCGFVGDVRYGNIKPLARWRAAIEAGTLPVETSERLTPRQRLAERLILGLRTSDGVPAAWLAERTASEPTLARRIEEGRDAGHLLLEGAGARLTESGFILSDALFVDLL